MPNPKKEINDSSNLAKWSLTVDVLCDSVIASVVKLYNHMDNIPSVSLNNSDLIEETCAIAAVKINRMYRKLAKLLSTENENIN
jgi:hypothetical protein